MSQYQGRRIRPLLDPEEEAEAQRRDEMEGLLGFRSVSPPPISDAESLTPTSARQPLSRSEDPSARSIYDPTLTPASPTLGHQPEHYGVEGQRVLPAYPPQTLASQA